MRETGVKLQYQKKHWFLGPISKVWLGSEIVCIFDNALHGSDEEYPRNIGAQETKAPVEVSERFSLTLGRTSSDKVPSVENPWWLSALSVITQQSSPRDSVHGRPSRVMHLPLSVTLWGSCLLVVRTKGIKAEFLMWTGDKSENHVDYRTSVHVAITDNDNGMKPHIKISHVDIGYCFRGT